MLNFKQLIIRKFLFLFVLLFFIISTIIYFWTKSIYIQHTKNSLKQSVELLSLSIHSQSDLDTLAIETKKRFNFRLTIINQEGKVLAESHKKRDKMDNHRYREEILIAQKNEYGVMIRYSHSLRKNLLYVAKKYFYEGQTYYIRVSQELKNIYIHIYSLFFQLFVALTLFFIFIIILAYKLNKEIQKEIQKILQFLKALTKKQKNTYIHSDFTQEFSQITKLLTKVSLILVKKDKQKLKYTHKLQLASQQKDDIISAISHEFKNPISVINGYSQTLLHDKNLNIAIQQKFIQKIYNNGSKLNTLIDTLRLSIKLDKDEKALELKSINLLQLIQNSLESIKPNYPDRKTQIRGDENLCISVDPSLFDVLLSNLIENAMKYSEDDIEISFNDKALHIQDKGIGISKKNLKLITDKFYRINKNKWNNSLGLGLFLVQNITKLHHFTLQIESQEDEGSTFSIYFYNLTKQNE